MEQQIMIMVRLLIDRIDKKRDKILSLDNCENI